MLPEPDRRRRDGGHRRTRGGSEWSWRQQYRLWQANREVFLYPENYVLPELRTDASPFFTDLENDLRQTNCDADAAEAALENYLRKLVGVARLQVAAHYNEVQRGRHDTCCTSSRTPAARRRSGIYRTRTGATPDAGSWSAWQPLNLDIASRPSAAGDLGPAAAPGLAGLQADRGEAGRPAGSDAGRWNPQPAPQKFWSVEFAMSELSAGQWQPKQTLTRSCLDYRRLAAGVHLPGVPGRVVQPAAAGVLPSAAR